jgi:hypothetical protein
MLIYVTSQALEIHNIYRASERLEKLLKAFCITNVIDIDGITVQLGELIFNNLKLISICLFVLLPECMI